MEQFRRPGLGFDWRNVTCPMCKVLFTLLDIALLVIFEYLAKLSWYEFLVTKFRKAKTTIANTYN